MATDHICQNENIVKNKQLIAQGAEALIYKADYFSPSSPDPNTCQKVILKIRPKKNYRIESLDKSLRRSRTRAELKALEKAKTSKINCPKLIHSDKMSTSIIMEEILGVTLKQLVNFIAIDCYGTVTGCNTDVVIPAEDESEDEQDQLVDLSKSGSDILANLLKPLVIQVADLVAKLLVLGA